MIFIYVLIGEHFVSYMFGIFREHDLQKNGKKNPKNGIEFAQRESYLRGFEIIFDLGIFIWATIYIIGLTNEEFNSLPFLNFWIMIDMIIMMFTLPYTVLSKYMMQSGEITKNIFTLYQVQKKKLKRRREHAEKAQDNWKSWFEKEEEKEDPDIKFKAQKRVKSTMLSNGKSLDEVKKKKVKKPVVDMPINDYAAEINAENRKAEAEDDETSDSSSDSSSSSEDENEIIMKKTAVKHEIIVREEDFEENEKLKFTGDVYNFTICANMTKCCSPLQ